MLPLFVKARLPYPQTVALKHLGFNDTPRRAGTAPARPSDGDPSASALRPAARAQSTSAPPCRRAPKGRAQTGSVEPDEDGLSSGGNWVLSTTFGRLDIMQDVPGLRDYRHLRDGAVEVNGTLYAGYDELLSMKSAAGRDEDLRDIAALKQARGE